MNDLVQIGLSDEAHSMLTKLREDGYFEDLQDGYRAAIAYAIALELKPVAEISSRKNMFHSHAVDPHGDLQFCAEMLIPDQTLPTNRLLQGLADAGVRALFEVFDRGEDPF